MAVYTFVFGYLFRRGQAHFASFVFIGLTLWEFFNRMLTGSVRILADHRELVAKVYIPKYVLLAARSLTYLFKMGISLLLAIGLMVAQGVPFSATILWLPVVILVLYVAAFALGMFLMHLGVLFSDMQKLVTILMRVLFYLSGVFYNIRVLAGKFLEGKLSFWMIRANPAAFCMDEARKVMLDGRAPSFEGLLLWLAVGLVLLGLGAALVHRNENTYAKII